MSVRILHFADAHIDIANYGRHDPATGLAQRVADFLNSLDQIVDAAVNENVDLVIFAGDAYKDRNPQPTFQRAWGERIMRLSRAGIPTIMLIGNHDLAPAHYRAHTLQEFVTFEVPGVFVADRIGLWRPEDLGVPVQVLAIPWITRSRYLARHDTAGKSSEEIRDSIATLIGDNIAHILDEQVDPSLPLILTAHASVVGATYGSERRVMLGEELTLNRSLVTDKRFDYVALGHIHKHQVLNEKPPVVYSGSIERIDFGEAREEKGYVLAEVGRGRTEWRFVPLKTRHHIDIPVEPRDADTFMDEILKRLPTQDELSGAICRVQITYPADFDPLLSEQTIREHFADAFDLRIVRHRLTSRRSRVLPEAIESLGPYELLNLYWSTKETDTDEITALMDLARTVLPVAVDGPDDALPPAASHAEQQAE